jgi:hypothetical protein
MMATRNVLEVRNRTEYGPRVLWALSDEEINDFFGARERLFNGVYPKDGLAKLTPQLSKKARGSIVVNMNNTGQAGSHWTAILMDKDRTIYFDSFGVVPSNEVLAFMKKRKGPMFYVDRQLQDPTSASCGWFCLYMITECTLKGRDILDVLSDDFTYDVKQNERRLRKYMSEC